MFNKFNQNNNNDSDSKRIQEIQRRNQTRNNSPSFSSGEQTDTTVQEEQSNNTVQEQSLETSQNVDTVSKSPAVAKGLFNTPSGFINFISGNKLKRKLLLIGIPIMVSIFTIMFVIVVLTASKEERRLSKNLLKKFSSITNTLDGTNADPDANFPPIGQQNYDSYFKKNVKDYLINYLSKNGYCSPDKKDCEKSDAYEFFYRFLKVVIAFERGEGLSGEDKGNYYVDSGLLYETIGHNRSDEEMFLGATESLKGNSWISFIKALFSPKTDEISKLANKFWIQKIYYTYDPDVECKVVSKTKRWEFSLNKYVAFLMYGDTMNYITTDECGNLTATNKDLNIEASNVKSFINDNERTEVTHNSHSYTYGGCSATDSDYEGEVTSGYFYTRLKDYTFLNISESRIPTKVSEMVQTVFNRTVAIYGESSYCSGGIGIENSTYGTNICTYQIGKKTYSNLKIQSLTCEKQIAEAKPIPGEELVDFEKYITGVVYQENGGAKMEALKVQAIASRTFTLTRRSIKTLADGTQVIPMRNCTWDQVYCDPDKGCWSNVQGGSATAGGDATVHSGYAEDKTWKRKPLAEDSKVRQAVNEVAGELLLDGSGSLLSVGYNSTAQKAWDTAASSGKDYTSIILSYYESAKDISKMKCESVGAQASGVSRSERMKYLFPNGVPVTESEMRKYLTTIEIPINNEQGKKTTMTLTVHKKLAPNFKQAFTDIQKIGFKIKRNTTSAYNWRMMATDSSKLSYHSYGSVVDVNWNDNPLVYGNDPSNYKPGVNEYSVTKEVVAIFKKYGFYWGGDWSSYKDYMHFTYTNN